MPRIICIVIPSARGICIAHGVTRRRAANAHLIILVALAFATHESFTYRASRRGGRRDAFSKIASRSKTFTFLTRPSANCPRIVARSFHFHGFSPMLATCRYALKLSRAHTYCALRKNGLILATVIAR